MTGSAREHFDVPVKTYLTPRVADMLRERRGDVSEAKYIRRILCDHLGIKED